MESPSKPIDHLRGMAGPRIRRSAGAVPPGVPRPFSDLARLRVSEAVALEDLPGRKQRKKAWKILLPEDIRQRQVQSPRLAIVQNLLREDGFSQAISRKLDPTDGLGMGRPRKDTCVLRSVAPPAPH